jgi:hypothetical protein
VDGEWEKFGFYTPRFVEATDAVLAAQVALEDFRQSLKYQELIERSLNAQNDPPLLGGEDVTQVQGPDGNLAAGLAFYRQSGD